MPKSTKGAKNRPQGPGSQAGSSTGRSPAAGTRVARAPSAVLDRPASLLEASMAEHRAASRDRNRALGLLVAAVFLPLTVFGALVGTILGVVITPLLGAIVAAVLGPLLGGAVAAWLWFRGPYLIVTWLGAQRQGEDQAPRIHNILDWLCAGCGLVKPDLYVVDSPALSAMSLGRNRRETYLVVTSGLLEGLDSVEMEGVVAHELCHLRGPGPSAVTVAGIIGMGLAAIGVAKSICSLLVQDQRELEADLAAVAMTRYPPGLLGALGKMESACLASCEVQPRSWRFRAAVVATEPLWLSPIQEQGSRILGGESGSLASLRLRMEALREL
ncbi:MAG: M48 family metalloprotease [Actinobacteria bacterium]|nr:M48 family metalloprotease [Actinomycetota bacterium]